METHGYLKVFLVQTDPLGSSLVGVCVPRLTVQKAKAVAEAAYPDDCSEQNMSQRKTSISTPGNSSPCEVWLLNTTVCSEALRIDMTEP